MALSNIVSAEPLSWVQQSTTYDVWLGVVSATDAGRDQELTRMHRTVRHGKYPTTVMTRHVMVSVFKRPTNERVANAEIVAELVENDLIHLIKTSKRLELTPIYRMPSFCNYFDLHWNGKYRIEISIREPGSAPEKVSFLQEVTDLPQ